ncbi:MAG: efflux transporter outer membrane subunit [Bacteroidales bacterium]|nr:efflux transporter outer membrane subunit [Bacteroidales bacterium]
MKQKNSYKFGIISILLVLGMAGCMVGPNFQKPVVESASQFRFDSIQADTFLNMKWWELFQDEQLKALIIAGLVENSDVRIAASRIEEARAALGYNKADIYPSVGYDGSVSRGNVTQGGGKTDGASNFFTLAPALVWELDFWGKYRRATEAARAELLASEYGQRAVMIGLISEIAGSYYRLLDYDMRYEIATRTLESRTESKKIIQERFDKGIVPELDLNQAQIQEAIAASSIPIYKRQIAKTENYLSILTGKNPSGIPRAKPLDKQVVPPEIPIGIPSDLLARRPDVLAAEQMVAAQNARIGVAEAMRFPSISLTGLFGAASTELSTFISGDAVIWSVSGGLLGPIFNFGKNKRRVEIEKERTTQAYLAYENTVLHAFREVDDALLEVQTYEQELAARQYQLDAAINASALSQARYDGGVTSYLEVLESDRSLFQAELYVAETLQNRMNAYVKLYKSLGGGWISETETTQP